MLTNEQLNLERDMIITLLKQLRVNLYNMANEELADLEYQYLTNILIGDIDFMFRHGYLRDGEKDVKKI